MLNPHGRARHYRPLTIEEAPAHHCDELGFHPDCQQRNNTDEIERVPEPGSRHRRLARGSKNDCKGNSNNPRDIYQPANIDYEILVVVHVLHNRGKIDEKCAKDGIELLNQDFGKYGQGRGSIKTGIRFKVHKVVFNNSPKWVGWADGGDTATSNLDKYQMQKRFDPGNTHSCSAPPDTPPSRGGRGQAEALPDP